MTTSEFIWIRQHWLIKTTCNEFWGTLYSYSQVKVPVKPLIFFSVKSSYILVWEHNAAQVRGRVYNGEGGINSPLLFKIAMFVLWVDPLFESNSTNISTHDSDFDEVVINTFWTYNLLKYIRWPAHVIVLLIICYQIIYA